ncbi:hypothetical protein [Burkholderia gladioli]|uniref:hypothetical protein n=1 Tax=Burkholderia gladioli TaxID=28095 RepID=UPI001C5D5532|nr:hypothetical protein [Burkholderia gladioli]MBW5285305.1 hypothetical protein [Burkholderia gladioli]
MNNFRCRPGDLARVIRSKNPALVGRIVLVERLHDRDSSRWKVTVLGEPVFGTAVDDHRPIVTSHYLFRDLALKPLRGNAIDHEMDALEVDHA